MHTTPDERLAIGAVALLLAAGAGLRLIRPPPPLSSWQLSSSAADTSDVQGFARLRLAVRAGVETERIAARALGVGERIDANRASSAELQRLPRVGSALAERIVSWRAAHGPFRSLADLDSVPGIGPGLLGGIAPHLRLPAAPPSAVEGPLDLNRATTAQLEALPGVGPALAGRIVEWRMSHGRFRAVAELDSVPGIGPALLARLSPRLRVAP